ncbi:MAG: peptidase [Acidobacteria bacterium]|nr:peptidase [Acidobacteriota bacterium]
MNLMKCIVVIAGFAVVGLNLSANQAQSRNSQDSASKPAAESSPSARKRALLVGIEKYDRRSKEANYDWWDLNTSQDVALLKEVLIKKFQFDKNDILVLDSPDRTKHKDIIDAFREFLIKPTKKGDIVFFHYSGHGQQIPDDGNDEVDGYDESLVPSDYVSQKDGSMNIRDDEIGKLLDELKLHEPSNVTISLDSCFSGTATRGELKLRSRGGPWKGKPVAKEKIRGEDTSPSGLLNRGEKPFPGYVFLSATSPAQTAKQDYNDVNEPMGLYTYSLVKALDASGPRTTYRDLFERLNDTVTRRQHDQNPQLEGELDKVLMEGTALPPQRYMGVKVEMRRNAKVVVMQAGKLQGMTEGSRFGVYPSGTKDPKDGGKLGDAVLSRVDLTTAVMSVDGLVDWEKLRTARAFETEHKYDDKLLTVVTQGVEALKGGPEALAQIKSLELIENDPAGKKPWNVLIRRPIGFDIEHKLVDENFRGAVLERNDGSILGTVPEGPDLANGVKQALEAEVRWQTVKSLENTDANLRVELRLIPVEVELDHDGFVTKVLGVKPLHRTGGSQIELAVGDHVMLEVRNVGEEDVFVTVLNLRSDGKVGPGWPQQIKGVKQPDDVNFLKQGGVLPIPEPYVFRIEEPLGQESFRAIATREPTDYTPLIDSELLTRGGPLDERGGNAARSPLGRILKSAQKGKRSGINMAVPPSWATATVTYTIVGAKPN